MNGTAAPLTAAPVQTPWFLAIVVALGAFMESLDLSIANVVLPHIAGNLSASLAESTWVLTSYVIANAISIPLSGWLSTLFGRKRYFLICSAGFVVASFLCGIAPSLGALVFFRAVQGLAGGGMQPASQAILADAFPPPRRAMAFAMFSFAAVVAPAIGPTLGGWITDAINWRWIFLLNIPVGIVLVTLTGILVHDPPAFVAERQRLLARRARVDYFGLALLVVGIGSLQFVIDRGQEDDWLHSHLILGGAVIAAITLIAFVIWELGEDEPIVDLRLLANRNFAMANFLMVTTQISVFGATVLLPQMMQELYGYTASLAGEAVSPAAYVILCMLPVMGRLINRVDPRWVIFCGMMILPFSLFRMAQFSPDTTFWQFASARMVLTFSLGLIFVPLNLVAYAYISPSKSSAASSLINFSRNFGGGLGISIVTTMLARISQSQQTALAAHVTPGQDGYRQALDGLTGFMSRHSGDAGLHAMAAIEQAVHQQARLLAYLHGFQAMALGAVLCVPLIFLVRRPPRIPRAKPAE